MITNLQAVTAGVAGLAAGVAGFLRDERGRLSENDVRHKGFNDLVTWVDHEAERRLVDGLSRIVPGAGFLTEENTRTDAGEYRWVVDPLDGTTNYIHGVPCYCVSIALMHGNRIVAGVVHEVNLDESFSAWKDAPALLNGKEIRASGTAALKDALLATGFPYTRFDRMKPYMDVFDYCMKNTHGLRRLGSAAVDLAYVAAGRFEGFYEYGLHAWDVAAGALLVQQAGGRVSDFSGGDGYVFGGEIIATNAGIYEEFFGVVRDRFQP